MTSKFGDMEGFLHAVVLEVEQQRKNEARDEDEDDESDGEDVNAMDVDEPPRFSTLSGRLQSIHAQLELQKRHKKASKARDIKAAGPRLKILRNMPFVIPLEFGSRSSDNSSTSTSIPEDKGLSTLISGDYQS